MVFSSPVFLTVFLPLVLGIYFLAQEKLRNTVLLAGSLFFYAWGEPKAVFVMLILTAVSYAGALRFAGAKQLGVVKIGGGKPSLINRALLLFLIVFNLSALFYYKYWCFFLENVNLFAGRLNFEPFNNPQIALPIGISFYVFQILAYVIDAYRGCFAPQKNFIALATYVSMFPQLVAGPIVRYQSVEEDLPNRGVVPENVYAGLRRFVLGLAKKVLIADQMAAVADAVFNAHVNELPCVFAWAGALAYTFQIFYDFSGYSDMAIGLGRVFNFHFPENFNYPYAARSVQEFWRRWHISLSSWFRDYVYIPLGGNRKGQFRTYLNMYIVFGLCGLWHGATWNFVVWGLYHGTMLVIERAGLNKLTARLPAAAANLYVWIFAVAGWVIFRAETLPKAGRFLRIMFCGNPEYPANTFYPAADFLTYSNLFALAAAVIYSYPYAAEKYRRFRGGMVDTLLILFLFAVTYVFALTSTFSPFIYFRF